MSVSCALSQTETTYTSSDTHQMEAREQFVYGFNTALGVPPGKTYIETSGELPATVYLQSISLGSVVGANPATTSYKIAVYQYGASYGTIGTFRGLSQAARFSDSDGSISFTFDHAALETNSNIMYMFMLVGADMTEDLASESAGLDVYDFFTRYGARPKLDMIGLDSYSIDNATSSYLYDDEFSLTYSTDFVLPAYTITMTEGAAVVPEPATAAFGVLGLAALAMGRRKGI